MEFSYTYYITGEFFGFLNHQSEPGWCSPFFFGLMVILLGGFPGISVSRWVDVSRHPLWVDVWKVAPGSLIASWNPGKPWWLEDEDIRLSILGFEVGNFSGAMFGKNLRRIMNIMISNTITWFHDFTRTQINHGFYSPNIVKSIKIKNHSRS